MDRLQRIQEIMAQLRARSGKKYAVSISKGRAQLVIISREAGKTITTPVSDWMPASEVYELADSTAR